MRRKKNWVFNPNMLAGQIRLRSTGHRGSRKSAAGRRSEDGEARSCATSAGFKRRYNEYQICASTIKHTGSIVAEQQRAGAISRLGSVPIRSDNMPISTWQPADNEITSSVGRPLTAFLYLFVLVLINAHVPANFI